MSNIDNPKLSEKIAKLESYVAWFESDEFEVEQSLDKYREAEILAKQIEKELADIKNEIVVVKKKFDQ